MAKRNLRKLKKAKNLVTEVVSEKTAGLNPLTPRPEEPVVPANVPKITDETIAEHREDVLSGARKYIYPLAHSKHRIIVITSSILAVTLLAFLVYCTLAMYKLYQYNSFLYRVTQVVPFPIARADGHFVDYENYLFELRHYVHYYETQIQRDLSGTDKQQLLQYRKQALETVINNTYIKDLAKSNSVSVSDKEVDQRISVMRDQNRFGANNKVFSDVLRDYLGWSLNDFKHKLKQVMLADKLTAKLDTKANQRAQAILQLLQHKADFAKLAKKYSDDSSKNNGGNYPHAITKSDPNVSPQVVDALFKLKKGQFSDIILASPVQNNASPTLEIVRVIKNDGKNVTAQHISIHLKDISSYISQQKTKNPPHLYVHF